MLVAGRSHHKLLLHFLHPSNRQSCYFRFFFASIRYFKNYFAMLVYYRSCTGGASVFPADARSGEQLSPHWNLCGPLRFAAPSGQLWGGGRLRLHYLRIIDHELDGVRQMGELLPPRHTAAPAKFGGCFGRFQGYNKALLTLEGMKHSWTSEMLPWGCAHRPPRPSLPPGDAAGRRCPPQAGTG